MKVHARKSTVDQRVAFALGAPKTLVEAVTNCFLEKTIECLVEYGAVTLDPLGRLSVVVQENRALKFERFQRKLFVAFKKSLTLRDAIKSRNEEVPYGKVRSGRVIEP